MQNIYKLKQKRTITFLGSGSFGCIICPPLKLTDEFEQTKVDFLIPNFSFNNIISCNFVGKILAVNTPGNSEDTYESELKNLLIIQDLDPEGKYTPQLIYANTHSTLGLLASINRDEDEKLYNCLKNSNRDIFNKENKYGYIILKHVGTSLEKYLKTNINSNMDLINFLQKIIKLLEFLDIIYKKHIHMDIKYDNITETDNGEMFLIDFGRFQEINKTNITKFVDELLRQSFFMYSFEPKIYYNLLNKKEEIKNKTINELINYIDDDFELFIKPYVVISYIKTIFQNIFSSDWITQLIEGNFITFRNKQYNIQNIDDYIRFRQKQYFINYLEIKYSENISNNDKIHKIDNIDDFLYNMFLPIIHKIDMCCIGITLAHIIINYNDYSKYCFESPTFKEHFEKLLKDLLFNNFDDVKSFIKDLQYLIDYELLEIVKKKSDTQTFLINLQNLILEQ